MTQESRQVLIELLFLSLYLDGHLSLAEDDELTTALDSLGWESPASREKFVFSAFSRAREAATSPLKTEAFLEERTGQIKRDGEEAAALTWLYRIFGADGMCSSERWYFKQLEARFYPDSSQDSNS